MTRAALISVDWGTTSLRLYLVAGDGSIMDRRESGAGITSVAPGGFSAILAAACADWLRLSGPLPAILSGMVGSRQGWTEAPYVACPAGFAELAARTIAVEAPGFAGVRIVAGVETRDAQGLPDVMRGEECQIVGALSAMKLSGGSFVLPGTHSKWVRVVDGRIVSFATFMTGDVFAALKGHTILGRMMAAPASAAAADAAFARGVETARRSHGTGEWLHRIFSVRTLGLMGELADGDAADYLSGLLIGWELSGRLAPGNPPPILIGSSELTRRYGAALRLFGCEAVAAPQDCVCAGHAAIAAAAGLLAHAAD